MVSDSWNVYSTRILLKNTLGVSTLNLWAPFGTPVHFISYKINKHVGRYCSQGLALAVFVCMEQRPSNKFVVNGMNDSSVGFAFRDGTDPTNAAPVPGAKSPIYTINGHQSFRSNSGYRFGSTYGSFSNSCLGTSLSSVRINSEACNRSAEARGSPLTLDRV